MSPSPIKSLMQAMNDMYFAMEGENRALRELLRRQGLCAQVQTVLERQPLSGHVFVFRGRRGDIVKVLWFDGDGLCLLAKRLEALNGHLIAWCVKYVYALRSI